jgi:tetratricopeptide (TPR) repeat protein
MSGSTQRRRPTDLAARLVAATVAAVTWGCGNDQPKAPPAIQLFLNAQQFLAEGKPDQAFEALNASIASDPTVWAYRERAKLNDQKGNNKAAIDDCDAALKLFPNDPEILWLKGELAKPAAKRFQGRFKSPPRVK